MPNTTQQLAAFCKKKGFIYPSSEIYGGLAGFYDYGHLGTKLKHNFEALWRSYFLNLHDNFYEIETANIMPQNVFKASGHLEHFIDPVIRCSHCNFSERADHFLETHLKRRFEGLSPEQLTRLITEHNLRCPHCTAAFQPVTVLNMMFPVKLGVSGAASADSSMESVSNTVSQNIAYLRPETAQSPYVNFKLQYELQRKKLPLGLALIGRAYRNEISPRNLTLRMREFTQAELQIFFNPAKLNEHPDFSSVKDYELRTMLVADREQKMVVERTASELGELGLPQFYVYHLAKIQQFYFDVLKVPKEKFRFYQLSDKEKAFYNKYHFDLEIDLAEQGFTEMGGLHYRTAHDLKGHQEVSKQSMEILDDDTGNKFIPHVLELSFGVDRHVYALLDLNYDDDKNRGNIVLRFPSKLAPFMCAVFPLVKNKEEVAAKAKEVYDLLKPHFSCFYDESGAIGRRYARADEQGVRYCLTIDFESLEDNAVTIRNLYDTKQQRVKITELKEKLDELYGG